MYGTECANSASLSRLESILRRLNPSFRCQQPPQPQIRFHVLWFSIDENGFGVIVSVSDVAHGGVTSPFSLGYRTSKLSHLEHLLRGAFSLDLQIIRDANYA